MSASEWCWRLVGVQHIDTRGIQIHIARGRAPTNAGRRAAQPLACTRARRSTTTETNAAIDRNVRALRTTTTITNIF